MSSAIVDIPDDSMQCDICCYHYDTATRRPVMLQCGHSLCQTCFETSKRSCMNEGKPLMCSTCRVIIPPCFVPAVNYKLIDSMLEREKFMEKFAKMQAEYAALSKILDSKQDSLSDVCDKASIDVDEKFCTIKDEFHKIGQIVEDFKQALTAVKTSDGSQTLSDQVTDATKETLEVLRIYKEIWTQMVDDMKTATATLNTSAFEVMAITPFIEIRDERDYGISSEEDEDDDDRRTGKRGKEKKKRVLRKETVYVTGLPRNINQQLIEMMFASWGQIALDSNGEPKIRAYTHAETGKFIGQYMITYADETTATRVISQMNGLVLPATNIRLRLTHGSFIERTWEPSKGADRLPQSSHRLPQSFDPLPQSLSRMSTLSRVSLSSVTSSVTEEDATKVFATKLPVTARFDEICECFRRHGPIAKDPLGKFKINMFVQDGQFQGRCIIQYETEHGASNAIAMLNKTKFPHTTQKFYVKKHESHPKPKGDGGDKPGSAKDIRAVSVGGRRRNQKANTASGTGPSTVRKMSIK